ncbi:40-residue YVTN family beta-propeller repeat-containing protein [Mucilaginibacter mallensis]|uniref:40-residue YVTN family beta-propeller repeat-containing protein n=1 Tax=Mucilaginibacter mallensis TaxID=652787 RepID=A0A1H1RWW5_MUCMA|nr:YncE family protein [Mucilaginibacter mallensis]SDS40175.1 40-residue YVTN family beta-propeller repeat-containing protein [Mucilaginibacter mallensis]
MKKIFLTLSLLATIGIAPFAVQAQTYVADKTIPLPGDAGWDYLSIDNVNHRLYVSHGTSVNVIDLNTEQPVGVISNLKGIHGIAIDNKANRGFISDGRANAVVAFDLKTLATIATISLTDANGPDAIIYDSYSDRVFSFNGESNNSSVVDPNTLKQVGTVALGGGPEFAVSDGKGKIYNNLEDKSSLNVIDVKALKVIKNHPLDPCGGPTGIALDAANGRVFSVCRQNKGVTVVDVNSGKVISTLPIGAGVDAVAFDPQTKLIFASCGDGTTTIIKQLSADDYTVIQTLKTQSRARTMALDTKTHKIYLSVADVETGTRKALPNSFKVLVFKLQ